MKDAYTRTLEEDDAELRRMVREANDRYFKASDAYVAALRKMEKDILTLHRGLVGSGPEGKCSWCGAHFTEDGGRHAGSVVCSVINEYMDAGGRGNETAEGQP